MAHQRKTSAAGRPAEGAELAALGQKDVVAGTRRGRLARAVADLTDLLEALEEDR